VLKSRQFTFGRLYTWTLTFYYDKASDTLHIRSPWTDPGEWIDLGEGVRIRVRPESEDALEFEVKNFEKGFLAKRPDLATAWTQVKPNPIALRRMENTPFLGLFLCRVQQLISNRADQPKPPNGKALSVPGEASKVA